MTQEAKNKVFEKFTAPEWNVGIVVAGFNLDITEKLLESAKECALAYGVQPENISVEYVAGCVEIPLILQTFAQTKKYHALVALGAIIRGDTPHFDFVAKAVTEGVMRVQLDSGIPIGFGILTLENKTQAEIRLRSGYGSMEAALQSAKIIEGIK
ncbi:MAG: 6,7-dimethyl-8-ribityllumazine synthase [bacterium]